MPATENVWRNPKTMHVVFAISSIAMFAATLLMMKSDYADEWRPVQRVRDRLQARQLTDEYKDLDTSEFEAKEKELQAKLDAANAALAGEKDKLAQAEAEVRKFDGESQKLTREVKFQRAERDKARADLDLKVRDGLLGKALKPWQEIFDREQASVDELELALEKLTDSFNTAKDKLAELTRTRDEAQAAVKKHESALERLRKARDIIAPESTGMRLKRWLMEQPIVEGFNGPLKINQIWLPDLTINFGGMKDVARYDRCITCHVNIDKIGTGNVPQYPHDVHGVTMDNVEDYLSGKMKRKHADGSSVGYGHPFSTHPNPELYLTDSSPHPIQKTGCTSCHDGQGSGTSFQNASHSPNSPDIAEKWKQKYAYSYNHFWEYPMNPKRLAESACVKCHHNIVELGVNPKFGASAPKLFKGYELVRQYGCFGCHEINGYNAGKPIGPDLRLEPQTPEEAERIAGDPSAVAGTMRKVGPGLRHFSSKTNKAWAEQWVKEPKAFRPETRMPQFFGLSNQNDAHAKAFQPVEIAGIVAFLFAKSEEAKLDKWASDYTPDAERGKRLFSQRGCLACHSHADFPGIKADFGPNLTNAHQKISSMEWLYSWIREPTGHSSRTRMPNLYLEPETVGDQTVDPAADIAAYLLSNRDDAGKPIAGDDGKLVRDEKGPARFEQVAYEESALKDLVRLYLTKALGKEKTSKALEEGHYPEKEAKQVKSVATKPDEIELVNGPFTTETMLQYIGRRSISRYGCYGCHDIPGYEKARPIGTGLQDWGRKDPTKLALEHIEEFLHHHGEPDGSSTKKRAEEARENGIFGNFDSPEEAERELSTAYFYGQLTTHGRAGFLWQKLRDPRSYDYKKTETKGYDERLRMPRFPFNEQDIEAIATFILGLVAEPPAEKYVYRPQGAAKARIEGEKLLTKFNCTGCHMVELPEIYGVPEDLEPDELTETDYPEALELLLKLKPPQNAKTNRKLPTGEEVIRFHGLQLQKPDPEDDPADQASIYVLWETLRLNKDDLFFPTRKLEVKVKKQLEMKPARGGDFAAWLADALQKADREVNFDKAWEQSPPPLYREGVKVQTPWLYSFLKNPGRIRFTPVLRMPQFNMSDTEAAALANYFAAADGAEFPYQDVPQREPGYLSARERDMPHYLDDAWKMISLPAPAGICNGCHAVGTSEFKGGGDPKKVTHGPDLRGVSARLRPEWAELWIYKPSWITPYTSMPQNFPKNKPQFVGEEGKPVIFGGDGQKQVVGARDALMNYLRMLEKDSKATAAAPAGNAKAGGAQ